MGQINIFKINAEKHLEFDNELSDKYVSIGAPKKIDKVFESHVIRYELSLFIDDDNSLRNVEWDWLSKLFGDGALTSRSNPKGILTIRTENELYACSFGYSHFLVNQYCDTDFAFEFAKRLTFNEIHRVALLSPSSKRNKAVNTYVDYRVLEFDSGESFIKLKVKVDLPDGFDLFKDTIEIGRSVKLITLENSIDAVIDSLHYIQDLLIKGEVNYKIPLFNKISDKNTIEELEFSFAQEIEANPARINLSELDIIGVTEVFCDSDSSYEIKFNRRTKEMSDLDQETMIDFIGDCDFSLFEGLKKVWLISKFNGEMVRKDRLFNLIDYIDDDRRCLLTQGSWYQFNDDYLEYLEDSLNEIDVIYDPKYDYSLGQHQQFLDQKFNELKDTAEYVDCSEFSLKNILERKYYRELAFNLIMQKDYGYECRDRQEYYYRGHKIELMDLYKDETLISVKIGNASESSPECWCKFPFPVAVS